MGRKLYGAVGNQLSAISYWLLAGSHLTLAHAKLAGGSGEKHFTERHRARKEKHREILERGEDSATMDIVDIGFAYRILSGIRSTKRQEGNNGDSSFCALLDDSASAEAG